METMMNYACNYSHTGLLIYTPLLFFIAARFASYIKDIGCVNAFQLSRNMLLDGKSIYQLVGTTP